MTNFDLFLLFCLLVVSLHLPMGVRPRLVDALVAKFFGVRSPPVTRGGLVIIRPGKGLPGYADGSVVIQDADGRIRLVVNDAGVHAPEPNQYRITQDNHGQTYLEKLYD